MILCLLSIDFNTCSLAYTSRIIIHILEFILNKYQFKHEKWKLSEHELQDRWTYHEYSSTVSACQWIQAKSNTVLTFITARQ